MSIETSLMILAICALFLSVCLLVFLGIAIKLSLVMSKKMEVLSESTVKALREGTEIAGKIKYNIDATKPMFHSIAKVGSMMDEFTDKLSDEVQPKMFRKIVSYPPTHAHTPSVRRRKESKVLDFLEFLSLGILMWQNYKKGADNE